MPTRFLVALAWILRILLIEIMSIIRVDGSHKQIEDDLHFERRKSLHTSQCAQIRVYSCGVGRWRFFMALVQDGCETAAVEGLQEHLCGDATVDAFAVLKVRQKR